MIHHKNFPFHEPDDETDIIHVNHSRGGLRIGRLLFWLIVAAGIFFTAKYLYNLGKGEVYQAGTPVIEPIPEPYKTKPEDPGGMEIPNIDKEIYSKIKTPMDQAVDGPIDAYNAENSKPLTIEQMAEKNEAHYTKPGPDIVRPGDTAGSSQAKSIKVNKKGKVVDIPQAAPTAADAPKAKRIDVEKVLAKKSENEYWLQLGTFKTENEATKAWQETREKNSDILKDLTIKVTKSDMGQQGVLYRLQAGSAEDEAAAKSLCHRLSARRQSCFYSIIKTQNNDL